MQTDIHLWSNLAHIFLEWEMFGTKVVEKIKTHNLCPVPFPPKSYRLWDNVGKYCRGGAGHRWQYGAHALHGWILKTTNTHSQYVILICFPRQQWLSERPPPPHVTLYCIAWLVEIRRVIESRDAILTKQQQHFLLILSNFARCTHVGTQWHKGSVIMRLVRDRGMCVWRWVSTAISWMCDGLTVLGSGQVSSLVT